MNDICLAFSVFSVLKYKREIHGVLGLIADDLVDDSATSSVDSPLSAILEYLHYSLQCPSCALILVSLAR